MLPPFDGNGYRKRVLAAIEARGGPGESDPFEVYDLPVEAAESLPDDVVARQVDAVWAFWQKQRDHPKYRGLVTALLASHDALAAQLRSPGGRRWLAEQTREERARRDAARFAELDAALQRLVERFGGVPADKVDGLRGLAAAAGVDEAAFTERLRRHPAAGGTGADPAVLRQVRDGLAELGRIEGAPVRSLHALLELPPDADRETVRRRREALLQVNRQRRPDRRRALVDDLLAAAGALLVDGDPALYLDALAADVREALRPRVAAAVLVEDRLAPGDVELLVREAQAAGLDPGRAAAVVRDLAAEADTPVELPPPAPRGPGRDGWQAEVSAARAALRAGRPAAAHRHLDAATAAAGGVQPPIRVVRDEVAEVLARSDAAWRGVLSALAARRHSAAAAALEGLVSTAADVPGPGGESAEDLLRTSRSALAAADAALAAAGPGAGRERALLAVLDAVADHPVARAELTALPVAPATGVHVVPATGGAREVRWAASASPGPVEYRVLRLRPDGTREVVGSTRGTALEDGGYGEVTGHVVLASRLGVHAAEAVSGAAPVRPVARAAPAVSPAAPPVPPVASLTAVPHGRRLRLLFPAPADGTAEVRRLPAGTSPPAPGTVVPDPDTLGAPVPPISPGLAVDARPSMPVTEYVVLTRSGPAAVAGASAAWVVLPPVTGAARDGDRLRWTWPEGCTEVVVAVRPDAPPEGPDDPAATRRKVTNSRYDIDGGLPVDGAPGHVAVFACTRAGGRLLVAGEAPPGARVSPG
ncbi:hypothetical protein SAMN05660359_03651 [Geodermatophilus obscurus]|uniref:Uncharacterized protein n=1 Tax=Geodermatophilus obscurus TaxID=1861 RepID=A0A1I5HFK1_9ACTN|nr:hypothetical protein [Geodermatophilus obscurus]SFO46766.1 hypothetical protein SAMN05660359_03651 [Geodermatophilus obscurus]